jgi:hypothetical protein
VAQNYQYPSDAQLMAYGAASRAATPGNIRTLGANMQYPGVAPGAGIPIQRLSFRQRLAILIAGADAGSVLFPPQQPLQPIGQQPEAGVVGRVFDYPPGYNLRVTPRSDGQIDFATLKALADGYDVLRGLIERVKDKICTRAWHILPIEKHEKVDYRCRMLEEFFQYPDKRRTWQDWSRRLLEQVIVYDAPAIYIRPTLGGDVYSLEVMDGSMFSMKIGPDGEPPMPDMGPAYQQVIKRGLPAVDYIMPVPKGLPVPKDQDGNPYPELLYKPRNPRVGQMYGMGPVEQMITTVNIALQRETSLLSFYTHGATPDLIFSVPETWTSAETKDFKTWWDSVLSGNVPERRGTQFVPFGVKPLNVKEGLLTDETDQWLIRIMCFFMGLNPMPFIKQMNRGQEQTHHEEAMQEGLAPWQAYFTDLIGHLIRLKWGFRDLKFAFDEDDPVDPVDQSKIDSSDVQAGIYHPDEIRAKRGDEPMPDDMRQQMAMVNYRNAPNATLLSEEQEQAKSDAAVSHTEAMNAVQPKEPEGNKPPGPAKLEDIAALLKAAPAPQVKVDAPVTVNPPAVHIAPAPVNVTPGPVNITLPEMKASDVFVDLGATNVRVDVPAPVKARTERTVTYERDKAGNLVAKITDASMSVVRNSKEV